MRNIIVMTGVTVDGNSAEFENNRDETQRALFISNNLGGGTITMQAKDPQDGSWMTLDELTYTAIGIYAINLPIGIKYRANLSVSTGADVNVTVV